MKTIQYIGDKDDCKIFADFNGCVKFDKQIIILSKNEFSAEPLTEYEKQSLINSYPCAGRYVVRQYGEFFMIDEERRDSYAMHLPGFKFISKLKVNSVISIEGFTNPIFMSKDDMEILNSGRLKHLVIASKTAVFFRNALLDVDKNTTQPADE